MQLQFICFTFTFESLSCGAARCALINWFALLCRPRRCRVHYWRASLSSFAAQRLALILQSKVCSERFARKKRQWFWQYTEKLAVLYCVEMECVSVKRVLRKTSVQISFRIQRTHSGWRQIPNTTTIRSRSHSHLKQRPGSPLKFSIMILVWKSFSSETTFKVYKHCKQMIVVVNLLCTSAGTSTSLSQVSVASAWQQTWNVEKGQRQKRAAARNVTQKLLKVSCAQLRCVALCSGLAYCIHTKLLFCELNFITLNEQNILHLTSTELSHSTLKYAYAALLRPDSLVMKYEDVGFLLGSSRSISQFIYNNCHFKG